jgi:hypothetical protein
MASSLGTCWDWRKWWIISYAIGLILIPPIHYHNRLIFSAEWLLIPLFLGMIEVFLKGQSLRPPKALLFVWAACTLAFVAGIFRGDLAVKISIYDLKEFKLFSVRDDGIVFIRTMILFSTPWFVKNIFQKNRDQYLSTFMTAFKISILLSAVLAILDQRVLGLIDLKSWGYISSEYEFWAARARGTFNTPIDASFMYGISAAYLLTGPEALMKNAFNIMVLIFVLIAAVLTHGGTSLLALLISVLAFLALGRSFKKRDLYIALGSIVIAGLLAALILPHHFLNQKLTDFVYRLKTYRNYLSVAPSNPWIFLVGIGFSRLCSDNNLILLLIQGGILYFLAVLNWIWVLFNRIPKAYKFIFLFWGISWLSFDTMGYWGIGRFCWFLFGLIEVM